MRLKCFGIIIALASVSYTQPVNSQMSWEVLNLPVDHWSSATGIPEYPGGSVALVEYIRGNLDYPEIAKENAVEGTVRVEFTVGTQGCITESRILESLGPECDQEVLRLIEEMPCWKPAVTNGQPVDRTVILPVEFRLQPAF